MSDVDRALRWVAVGCLLAVVWMALLVADTRAAMDDMSDEVRVVVEECAERGRCEYAGDRP